MSNACCPPIRLGLLGCGDIAFWAHLRSLARNPAFVLTHAADPSQAARDRAATRTKARLLPDPQAILDNPDIDAVLIASPPATHAALALRAARTGKHLYVEKPIATTIDEFLPVLEAARAGQVVGVTGFNRRFHPSLQSARALIRQGRIGRVLAVQTAFCEPHTADSIPAWKSRRATGGGVLLDLGSHHFDLLRWFLDSEAVSISASITSNVFEMESAEVHLRFANGVTAQSHFSLRTGPADHFVFHGELGSLHADRHHAFPELRLRRSQGYGFRRHRVHGPPANWILRLRHLLQPGFEPSYAAALDGFATAIRGLPTPSASLEDGQASLRIALAAEESARLDQPVALAPCASS